MPKSLIRVKIAIAEKYGLVLSPGVPADLVEMNLSAVRDLVDNECTYEYTAARIIRNLNSWKSGYSVGALDDDLQTALKVGLLEFHLTDRCDLGCSHCFYGSSNNGHGATMPFSQLHKIKLLDPKAIVITGGGEPTLYSDSGRSFGDAMAEIRAAAPNAQLGLQTNGTVIPRGDWNKNFLYLRSSVDASNSQTYLSLKNRDFFDRVVQNTIRFAQKGIPYVGVGFLFEKRNICEIRPFLEMFYDLVSRHAPEVLPRFTVQFRPLGPDLGILESVRAQTCAYASAVSDVQLSELRAEIDALRRHRPEVGSFIDANTNLASVWGGNSGHHLVPFGRCFVALAYRLIRASGDSFPCFILVQHMRFCLGNFFEMDPLRDRAACLRSALCGYHFFNCRTEFCGPRFCRQSGLNRVAEDGLSAAVLPRGPLSRFFFF